MVQRLLQLLLAILIGSSAFGQTLRQTSEVPSRYLIDSVPFTRQMPNWCGPASLSSLLAYWDIRRDQKAIADCTFDRHTASTNGADLLLYSREIGLSAYSFNSSLPGLKRMVSQGYPVIVLQEMSRTWREGHFRIAVGFDDSERTITLRDGMKPSYTILQYSEFDYLWAKRGRWAFVAAPSEKDIFAKTLGQRNAVLHMDLAQAYLRRGNLRAAEDESLEALQIEPGNNYAREILAKVRSGKTWPTKTKG